MSTVEERHDKSVWPEIYLQTIAKREFRRNIGREETRHNSPLARLPVELNVKPAILTNRWQYQSVFCKA